MRLAVAILRCSVEGGTSRSQLGLLQAAGRQLLATLEASGFWGGRLGTGGFWEVLRLVAWLVLGLGRHGGKFAVIRVSQLFGVTTKVEFFFSPQPLFDKEGRSICFPVISSQENINQRKL